MPVTAIYAGILALLFLALSIHVVGRRRGALVNLGDGGDEDLLRRTRIHGNFAEYVPISLILMALNESLAAPVWLIHGLGLALVAGRIAHAIGIARGPGAHPGRVVGMVLTFAILVVAGLTAIVLGMNVAR